LQEPFADRARQADVVMLDHQYAHPRKYSSGPNVSGVGPGWDADDQQPGLVMEGQTRYRSDIVRILTICSVHLRADADGKVGDGDHEDDPPGARGRPGRSNG
jgi:hypothetical protein